MEPNAERQRTFEYAPGVRINYEIQGCGDKPALLLHGFGASLESWRAIQVYLEPHLLLHLVDLKGFGLSSKPKDGCYSIEDNASIIAAFVERLELSGLCLIGHSYGGAVAAATCFKLAEKDSADRVHSLILIDSPAGPQRLPFFIAWLRIPLLRRMLSLVPARSRARYVLRRISYEPEQVTDEWVDRYARFHDLPGSHGAMIATARQILPKPPDSIAGRLGSIRAPALILWGDHDKVVFRWQADLLKARIPDSKLVIIPRCGHLPQEERPEETAHEILNFLAG